jgi:hypothetical protein
LKRPEPETTPLHLEGDLMPQRIMDRTEAPRLCFVSMCPGLRTCPGRRRLASASAASAAALRSSDRSAAVSCSSTSTPAAASLEVEGEAEGVEEATAEVSLLSLDSASATTLVVGGAGSSPSDASVARAAPCGGFRNTNGGAASPPPPPRPAAAACPPETEPRGMSGTHASSGERRGSGAEANTASRGSSSSSSSSSPPNSRSCATPATSDETRKPTPGEPATPRCGLPRWLWYARRGEPSWWPSGAGNIRCSRQNHPLSGGDAAAAAAAAEPGSSLRLLSEPASAPADQPSRELRGDLWVPHVAPA